MLRNIIKFTEFLLLLYLSFFSVGRAIGEGSAELRSRFKNEAPLKWLEYQRLSKYLQGMVEESVFDEQGGGKLVTKYVHQVKQNDSCALSIRRVLTSSVIPEQLRCIGPRYSFVLKKKPSKSDWALDGFAKENVEESWFGSGNPPSTVVKLLANRGLVLFPGCWLPDFAKDESFQLSDVSVVGSDPSGPVRIEFKGSMPFAVSGLGRGNASGSIVFDPALFWLMKGYNIRVELSNKETNTATAEFFYQIKTGYPIIKENVIRFQKLDVDGQATGSFKNVMKHELHEVRNVPDAEFTLSAFGVPEMNVDWQRPDESSIGYWIIAIAVIGIFLALSLVIYARRRFQPAGSG